jgi:hypothetical protein
LFLNANLTDVLLANNRVTEIKINSYTNVAVNIKAKKYIFAMGELKIADIFYISTKNIEIILYQMILH